MKSWKTTLAGALAALGVFLTGETGAAHTLGVALSALGAMLTGLFAADHKDKTP